MLIRCISTDKNQSITNLVIKEQKYIFQIIEPLKYWTSNKLCMLQVCVWHLWHERDSGQPLSYYGPKLVLWRQGPGWTWWPITSEPGEAPPGHLYPCGIVQDPSWWPAPQPSHPKAEGIKCITFLNFDVIVDN